jgi:hypothetical protein
MAVSFQRVVPYLRPGIEVDDLGRTLCLIESLGNQLRLNEPPAKPKRLECFSVP